MAPKKRDNQPGQEIVPQISIKSVPIEVADKMQTIANTEGVSYNELYNVAFVKFIEAYEKANGKVKIKPKGKGLENI